MESRANQALEQFVKRVGVANPPGEWHTVDQAQIDTFADATFDHQFIHVDPVRAAEQSPYGKTIAHGFLTLSMISHLVKSIAPPDPNPFEGMAIGINYGFDRVRFPTPVIVGSRIRAHGELISADLKPRGTIQLKQRITVEIEGGNKPACVAEWLTRAIYP